MCGAILNFNYSIIVYLCILLQYYNNYISPLSCYMDLILTLLIFQEVYVMPVLVEPAFSFICEYVRKIDDISLFLMK